MKVAVWGLGKHSINNILPALLRNKNFSLQGVCSRNQDTLRNIADQFSCNKWSNSEEMLDDSSLDAVFLCTPPGLHYEQGIKILNANKHFWCEKPLTLNNKNSIDLLRIATSKNLSIFEGFMYLYHPHFLELKKIISKQLLGSLKEVKVSFDLPELESPGYRINKELGASAIFDLGVYPISLILNLFDKSSIKIISVEMNNHFSSFDMEGRVILKIDNKIDCLLEWSYNKEYKNEVSIKGSSSELFSEKIFSKKPNYLPYFRIKDQNGTFSRIDLEKANHFELMFDSFFSCTRDVNDLNNQSAAFLNLSHFMDQIINFN